MGAVETTSYTRTVLAVIAAAVIALFAGLSAARASDDAEGYVQKLADEVTDVLSDEALTTEDKASQLREMIDRYLDVKRIAYFALGKYRRDATDQGVIDAYVAAFKAYAISLYENRLSDYGGQTLKVTGSEDRNGKGTDIVVTSQIEGNGEPLDVNWRVIKIETGYTVVDVQIEGIWMALDLREQFASIISNNNGKVQALIDHLNNSHGEE